MKTQFRTVYAVVHTHQCVVMSMKVCAHYISFRGGIGARVKPSRRSIHFITDKPSSYRSRGYRNTQNNPLTTYYARNRKFL